MTELEKLQETQGKAHDKAERAAEIELAKRYKAAYDSISAELGKLYASMGDPPTIIEARKWGRLEAVQKAIAQEYKALARKNALATERELARAYSSGVFGSRWAYDQATGIELKWPVLSAEAVRATVWSSQTGEDFADRFASWTPEAYAKTNRAITQAIATGEPYAKTARKLKETLNTEAWKAMRIVRTESTRAYNQGHQEVYEQAEELGIKARKKWVATLDERTRDAHAALDGELADDDGLFWIGGDSAPAPGQFSDPANSVNCRCRVVDSVEGYSPTLRRIRGDGLVPYKTFREWAEPKGWTAEGGWPIEAKAKVTAEQARKY